MKRDFVKCFVQAASNKRTRKYLFNMNFTSVMGNQEETQTCPRSRSQM